MASYLARDANGWKFLPADSYSARALDRESIHGPCHWWNAISNPHGLCPICGEGVDITGQLASDGRLIGSCGDAFRAERFTDDCQSDPGANQMAY